jgi:hypothetical protein
LASLASSKYEKFQIRAKQTEAVINLMQIYTLALVYHLETGFYGNFENPVGNPDVVLRGLTASCSEGILGFSMPSCDKARYSYWNALPEAYPVDPQGIYTANAPATLIAPGCTGIPVDAWAVADPPYGFRGGNYGSNPQPWRENGLIYNTAEHCD